MEHFDRSDEVVVYFISPRREEFDLYLTQTQGNQEWEVFVVVHLRHSTVGHDTLCIDQ